MLKDCYGHFNGQELDGVECIAFLFDVKIKAKKEMSILRSWQKHFQEVGTPYIIERVGGILKLWKRNRVETMDGFVMDIELKD